MVDVNRIALYLAGNFPPYYKPFEKGYFIELLILNSAGTLDDAKVSALNQQSANDQQFYSMCISRLERHDPALVSVLVDQLCVPEDVIGLPIAGITTTQTLEAKVDELTKTVKEVSKPLLITEGVTDRDIITIARTKLHPNEEMPFEVVSSGTQIQNGSSDVLKNQLQFLSESILAKYKTIVGLFDNDEAGNKHFGGLNDGLFEVMEVDKFLRKHNIHNVYGLLLPIPNGREKYFDKDDANNRYLVIEHYFADSILRDNKMLKKERIVGSDVWEIGSGKTRFVKKINSFLKEDFINFQLLFDEIMMLI